MKFKQWLEDQSENGLKGEVLSDLEEYETFEEAISYLNDVMHGCSSGIVSRLIYYVDTIKFYDDNEDEIENLIENYTDDFGHKNRFEFIGSLNGADNIGDIGQEKNLLSWFAYEETARRLLEELEEVNKYNDEEEED